LERFLSIRIPNSNEIIPRKVANFDVLRELWPWFGGEREMNGPLEAKTQLIWAAHFNNSS
jgi:hypothetical protein